MGLNHRGQMSIGDIQGAVLLKALYLIFKEKDRQPSTPPINTVLYINFTSLLHLF
jgi:hypothetical protein